MQLGYTTTVCEMMTLNVWYGTASFLLTKIGGCSYDVPEDLATYLSGLFSNQ